MVLQIKLAETNDELKAVFRFRYEVYVEEMGRAQEHANHSEREISEPLDATAYNFLAVQDGKIVGVVRINLSQNSHLDYYSDLYEMERFEQFHPKHTSITTKLMVHKDFRKGWLAVDLAIATYELGIQNGILFDFIDCNDHLLPFFQGLGYREYRSKVHHKEYGEVTPLVFNSADLEHLALVRSPFRTLHKTLDRGEESVKFLKQKILPARVAINT